MGARALSHSGLGAGALRAGSIWTRSITTLIVAVGSSGDLICPGTCYTRPSRTWERIMRLLGLVAVLVGMSAVTMAGQSSHDPAPGVRQPGDEPFAQLRVEWARNLHDKHVDASVAEYTADGEFVQPDGSSVRGAAALKKLSETVTATYDSDLAFESHNLSIKDDR